MLIVLEVLYILATLLLAGKDATSYLLKSKVDDPNTGLRVNRWHRDGFLLASLIALISVLVMPKYYWFLLPAFLLIRLALFDLVFNKWSNLDVHYLGSTAKVDQLFIRIFGINGAVKKSIVALVLLVTFNIIFNGRL